LTAAAATLAVTCAAGVAAAVAVTTIATAVTTAITASVAAWSAAITIAVSFAGGCCGGGVVVEAVGDGVFGNGLVGEGVGAFFARVCIFGVGFLFFLADLIVDSVLFFEVIEVFFVSFEFGIGVGGTRDLVDGHLADHGSEVGSTFEGLLFIEVVHLFDCAGVEGVDLFVFCELFFVQDADCGVRCFGADDGGLVMDGLGGIDDLVERRKSGWLDGGRR
jgi:hypothetical protein